MRKLSIDLGLVIDVNVPDEMSDGDACGVIFDVSEGKGDPRYGMNMNADVAYFVGEQIKANLAAIESPVEFGGGARVTIKVEGDTRTPRQRAIEDEQDA